MYPMMFDSCQCTTQPYENVEMERGKSDGDEIPEGIQTFYSQKCRAFSFYLLQRLESLHLYRSM